MSDFYTSQFFHSPRTCRAVLLRVDLLVDARPTFTTESYTILTNRGLEVVFVREGAAHFTVFGGHLESIRAPNRLSYGNERIVRVDPVYEEDDGILDVQRRSSSGHQLRPDRTCTSRS